MIHNVTSRIAIYLLAAALIIFGIYHFLQPQNMLVYVPSFIPGGIIWVYVVGAAFILAAIAFVTHKQAKLAGYLLALLLFIFVLTIHLPNYLNSGDKDMQQMALVSVLKDTALAAFALYIASHAKPDSDELAQD